MFRLGNWWINQLWVTGRTCLLLCKSLSWKPYEYLKHRPLHRFNIIIYNTHIQNSFKMLAKKINARFDGTSQKQADTFCSSRPHSIYYLFNNLAMLFFFVLVGDACTPSPLHGLSVGRPCRRTVVAWRCGVRKHLSIPIPLLWRSHTAYSTQHTMNSWR